MFVRNRSLLTLVPVCLMTVCLSGTVWGQDQPAQTEQETQTLQQQIAQWTLRLARVELEIADSYNKQVGQKLPANVDPQLRSQMARMRQLPASVLARLRSNVQLAEKRLEMAQSPSTGDPEKIRREYLAQQVELAKLNLEMATRRRAEGVALSDLEIEKLRTELQLATLREKLADQPQDVMSVVDSLQRQLDRLGDELIHHDQRISALEQSQEMVTQGDK